MGSEAGHGRQRWPGTLDHPTERRPLLCAMQHERWHRCKRRRGRNRPRSGDVGRLRCARMGAGRGRWAVTVSSLRAAAVAPQLTYHDYGADRWPNCAGCGGAGGGPGPGGSSASRRSRVPVHRQYDLLRRAGNAGKESKELGQARAVRWSQPGWPTNTKTARRLQRRQRRRRWRCRRSPRRDRGSVQPRHSMARRPPKR